MFRQYSSSSSSSSSSESISSSSSFAENTVPVHQAIPSFLITELDNIVLEYHDDPKEKVDSTDYLPENYVKGAPSLTLFQKRLPIFVLLQHAVRGEYNEVNAMLIKNPWLLLEKATVTDYSGRQHKNKSVYQIAKGAVDQDVWVEVDGTLKQVVRGMVEMIEQHFLKLTNGETERLQQHREQFPQGYEKQEAIRIANDSTALNAVINVIAQASDDDCIKMLEIDKQIQKILRDTPKNETCVLRELDQAVLNAKSLEDFEIEFEKLKNQLALDDSCNIGVLKAIYQFRNYWVTQEVSGHGKHFNLEVLAEAFKLYGKNFTSFGDHWDSLKNELCWQKVIGFTQRFAPACDAQLMAQGLWSVLECGEISKRSCSFSYGGRAMFPVDSDLSFRLGHDFAAAGGGGAGGGAGGARFSGHRSTLGKLMSSKNVSGAIMQRPCNQSRSRCSVM